MTTIVVIQAVALLASVTAAATDLRSGRIPNWLTLPLVVMGLVVNALTRGTWGATESAAGLLLCAGVPWAVFRLSVGRAIGGGDVKLFGALGSLLGPTGGLEIELGALVLLLMFALVRVAFAGELLRMVRATVRLAVAPFSRKRIASPAGAELTSMRLGPAIAVAAFTSVAATHLSGWLPWLV
jgi:prepilin peptidase CpaA